ncbi:hypothetical protein F66182_9252 [Fusarium sp. NRRL 66182]|nr:hypothetical protein F66182_9252 [Fusarium sp. NRRL 66182]
MSDSASISTVVYARFPHSQPDANQGILGALDVIIHDRLEKQGLQMFPLLPENNNHCPIFFKPNIGKTARIVIIFGEPTQDLGIIARRVANGPGGLAKGSMVSVVRELAKQTASPNDPEPPSVVLANMGQRYWWPEGERSLTIEASADIPLPSLVHTGRRMVKGLNEIPGSETPLAHMATVFDKVLEVNESANIDVIAIGESCEYALKYFENEKNWAQWGHRLGGMLLMGTVFIADGLTNAEFRDFLAKASLISHPPAVHIHYLPIQRTRGYLISEEALDVPLAMPGGNPSLMIEPLGCPCFSGGEPHFTELILVKALEPALCYLQEIALTPDFVNPDMAVAERPPPDMTDENWSEIPEENKPGITIQNPDLMKEQIKQMRRWERFEKTGLAPDSDSDSDSDEEADKAEEMPQNGGKADCREGEEW